MDIIDTYYSRIKEMLDTIVEKEKANIEKAAH